ncbi:hypothetical protein GPECTOR_8g255 [Gonium pectorale]|uniref:Uncharacterized protein n=1 Tax=Gonium pectorale TaxID=33097 RepID=A0A150GSX1_GONPE|nr:hypothetical protein GPECTOR_8g255 [Gonium pectorale]|eukprot:KXZ52874.1 hypothetical protein GPECTOR_8g255 [Gonium pectorale]
MLAQLAALEALRLAWEAHARRQHEGNPAGSSARSGGDEALAAALQQQHPASMGLRDIADVLQLLGLLNLMPRYEWLTAAREQLRAALVQAEGEATAVAATLGGQDGSEQEVARRLDDLRMLSDVAGELVKLCWEADGQQAASSGSAEHGDAGEVVSEAARCVTNAGAHSSSSSSDGGGSEAAVPAAGDVCEPQDAVPGTSVLDSASDGQATAEAPDVEAAAEPPEQEQLLVVDSHAQEAVAAPQPSVRPEELEPRSELWEAALAMDEQQQRQDAELVEQHRGDPEAALARLQAELLAARGLERFSGAAGALGDFGSAAVAADAAIAELSSLLADITRGNVGVGAQPGALAGGRPTVTAARLAAMVGAAGALRPVLPSQLLTAAARLLAAMREGVAVEHVAAVVHACSAAGFRPPVQQLDQLALQALSDASRRLAALEPEVSPAAVMAADDAAAEAAEAASSAAATAAAATARALHTAAHNLVRLGCALNDKQFAVWAEAVAQRPLALTPVELVQLLEACCQRGFRLRTGGDATARAGSAALLAAALAPSRLGLLSAREAAAVAHFAVQQGASLAGPPGRAVLSHLAPLLVELPPAQLASLLPVLHAAGALPVPSASTAAWLSAHSAALLPAAEDLGAEQLLPLLRSYVTLPYAPPPLLLLGVALALEARLRSTPVPVALEGLELLLCRLRFQPNEGLAAALREDFMLRLMLLATKPRQPHVQMQMQPQQQLGGGGGAGLTAAQRLRALDVLAAARVRPHPAQLAALLDLEFATGDGTMAALGGEELARLLWHCVRFRGLPSWRFVGEWLQASAQAMQQEVTAAAGAASIGPGALVRVGWCLAQMGVRPDRSWRRVYQAALLAAMPELGAEELSLAAHSVQGLRGRPGAEWLEGLAAAAQARMDELDAASAVRLLHFVAAAEMKPAKEWMQAFFIRTLPYLSVEGIAAAGRPAASPRTASAFAPDHVVLLLRALSQLGFRPPQPWLDGALERLRTEAASLSPACFPIALSALARLCPDVAAEQGPGSAVDAIVKAAHDRRESFGEVEIRWFLETLGCHYPSYALPRSAEDNLLGVLRRREAAGAAGSGAGGVGQDGGHGADVAMALGDVVSEGWLQWPRTGVEV